RPFPVHRVAASGAHRHASRSPPRRGAAARSSARRPVVTQQPPMPRLRELRKGNPVITGRLLAALLTATAAPALIAQTAFTLTAPSCVDLSQLPRTPASR